MKRVPAFPNEASKGGEKGRSAVRKRQKEEGRWRIQLFFVSIKNTTPLCGPPPLAQFSPNAPTHPVGRPSANLPARSPRLAISAAGN